MRFLVTMPFNDLKAPPQPREMGLFIENVILPSLVRLAEWEKEGRVTGGVLAGRRGHAIIVDVESHEALGNLLRELPVWPFSDIRVEALESFAYRAEAGKRMAESMKTP